MPPRDKIRPWVEIGCKDCDFRTAAEWAALEHEKLTGHAMCWWGSQADGTYGQPLQRLLVAIDDAS